MSRHLLSGNDRANPRGLVELRFKMNRGFFDSLTLYCALTGERRSDWVRRCIMDGIERDLSRFPVRYCWLRPGATIYTMARGVFTPVARASGGERAWPIEVIMLPRAIAPLGQGWKIDVTSDRGGYEGRDVCVRIEDVVGEKPPVNPPV